MNGLVSQFNPGPCEGFDDFAGQRWIYPNNMPIRGYQKAAVEMSLFHNAMIVLPTGFGKTFIAAVVMYNFYNWYPCGKIIFVAPTRPLVTQQIDECKKVSGIPASACVELTGMIGTEKRKMLLEKRRVIFATPQVIENDLKSGCLEADSVRCIVIDEAHKAQGNFSYVNIVRHLQNYNPNGFRVLALSATPGSDLLKVQQVMQNLFINDIMFRTESSIDLMQYRNQKNSRAWTVELIGKHKDIVEKFMRISEPVFKDLHRAGILYSDSIRRANKYSLIKVLNDRDGLQVRNGLGSNKVKHCAGIGISLLHFFELLTLYGLRVFYANVKALEESRKNARAFLAPKIEFGLIKKDIEEIFGEDLELNADKRSNMETLLKGHPKLSATKNILIEHFKENEDKLETRAIVFTKYRDSVIDIVQTLKTYEPVLKPACFIGQNTSKGGEGMTQREQAQVIKDFKSGVYNVVVATCVAEEGLDIGEIDLMISYDASGSISTTQRRGRTGRKRTGTVHSILTKGFEEDRLKKAGDKKRLVEDQLYKKENYIDFRYKDAPRMVPLHITPACFEHKIFPVNDDLPTERVSGTKTKRKRTVINVTSYSEKKCKVSGEHDLMNKEKLAQYEKTGSSNIEDGVGESSFKSASELLASDWPNDGSSSDDDFWK